MLKLNLSDEQGGCFKFLGESSSESKPATHLITNNTSLLVSSDASLDSCSFGAYFNDSDAAILAFGESYEAGYFGGESCGSIAFSGGESCGSIASGGSSGGFSGGGFSGGGGCSAAC